MLAVAAVLVLGLAIVWLAYPIREHRVERVETRLDEFMPVWQFGEHTAELQLNTRSAVRYSPTALSVTAVGTSPNSV